MPVVALSVFTTKGDRRELVVLCEENDVLVDVFAVVLETGDIVVPLCIVIGSEGLAATLSGEDALDSLDRAFDVVIGGRSVGRSNGNRDSFAFVGVDNFWHCASVGTFWVLCLDFVGAEGVERSWDLELELVVVEADIFGSNFLAIGSIDGEVSVVIHAADNHNDNDNDECDSGNGANDTGNSWASFARLLSRFSRSGFGIGSLRFCSFWCWLGRRLLGGDGLSLAG